MVLLSVLLPTYISIYIQLALYLYLSLYFRLTITMSSQEDNKISFVIIEVSIDLVKHGRTIFDLVGYGLLLLSIIHCILIL